MTDPHIFQFLGIMYLAIGIGMLINPDFYKKLLADFSENPPAIYISGLLTLFIGYLLVTFHNIWPKDEWPVVITIFGWVALLKGLLLILLPSVFIRICKFFEKQMVKYMTVWAVIVILAGWLLAWLGYFAV